MMRVDSVLLFTLQWKLQLVSDFRFPKILPLIIQLMIIKLLWTTTYFL